MTTTRKQYGALGTVSHATMRNVDLIESFSDCLRELAGDSPTESESRLLAECAAWLETESSASEDPLDASAQDAHDESGGELAESLFDALGEFSPPYCYFGAHAGDGSDYGFWTDMDSLEEAARYEKDVLKVEAGDEPDYIMSVSDHGNVTLYRVTLTEVWGVV